MIDNTLNTLTKSVSPLISVLLPIYNGEQYLREAIDSILSQTFTDFELIIIDDGSTDGSSKILSEYEQRDARIKVIRRENRGLATTLNDSIDIARGAWIARMDQDDIALPQRFQRQLQWLEETDADICGSWVRFFGTSDNRILKHAVNDEAIKMELLFCCAFAHPTVIMKTELVKNLRYAPAWDKAEDYELWVRAACAGWKMANIPEVLLMYRQHASQISTASSLLQQELSQKVRLKYWTKYISSMELKKKWILEILKLRDPFCVSVDMEIVDKVFEVILRNSKGEARDVAFDHMTRLYYRAASNSRGVVARWENLNKLYGNKNSLKIKIQLYMLSIMKISPDSKVFLFFKNIIAKSKVDLYDNTN